MTELLFTFGEAREHFMQLVSDVRPELYRYCTRMTGSVFDAEDVVQDSLAKAYFALAEMTTIPPLRPWLFRIAHNTAMDFLRRHERRMVEPRGDIASLADGPRAQQPEEENLDTDQLDLALHLFGALPPVQRSALALKDVLGLSLEETSQTMGLSLSAVKAALVRARVNVRAAVNPTDASKTPARPERADIERLRHYAHLFNTRDWDGLRALFGQETRLDVVTRLRGRDPAASEYFGRYLDLAPRERLRAQVGWVHAQPVLAMFGDPAGELLYFVQLAWRDERLLQVRDFRHVPYIARDADFAPVGDVV